MKAEDSGVADIDIDTQFLDQLIVLGHETHNKVT